MAAFLSVSRSTSKRKGGHLTLVEWNLGQNGRLDQVFGFFDFRVRVHQLAIESFFDSG